MRRIGARPPKNFYYRQRSDQNEARIFAESLADARPARRLPWPVTLDELDTSKNSAVWDADLVEVTCRGAAA